MGLTVVLRVKWIYLSRRAVPGITWTSHRHLLRLSLFKAVTQFLGKGWLSPLGLCCSFPSISRSGQLWWQDFCYDPGLGFKMFLVTPIYVEFSFLSFCFCFIFFSDLSGCFQKALVEFKYLDNLHNEVVTKGEQKVADPLTVLTMVGLGPEFLPPSKTLIGSSRVLLLATFILGSRVPEPPISI